LKKILKKQIRKFARSFYKNKVKDLCQDKPKNWYSQIKILAIKRPEPLNFNLEEPPKTTANILNKLIASIVPSLPPLSYETTSVATPFNFPI
jgi:hypothetical protein